MVENACIKDLESREYLSYIDYGDSFITLIYHNKFICSIEVFFDPTNEYKEFIMINNEAVYLDTLKKI